jgi:DNA-binding CsgD family transcriptional regulator
MRLNLADELIAGINSAASEEALHAFLTYATKRMGFDHFAVSCHRRPGRHGTHHLLLHNYPKQWAQTYVRLGFAARDPVRRHCEKSSNGFAWSQIEISDASSQGDADFMSTASDNGLADGYTVPRYIPGEGGGSCSFAIGPETMFPHDMRYVAELVGAVAVHNALSRINSSQRRARRPLSARQLQCLIWVARGRTVAQTAILMGIAKHTVTQHLRAARDRYDADCLQQLVIGALADNIITFADIFEWGDKH